MFKFVFDYRNAPVVVASINFLAKHWPSCKCGQTCKG